MNNPTIGIAILICATGILGFYSCIGTKHTMNDQWASYEDWDLNNDRRIVEDEFVECYLNNNFFRKWSPNGDYISAEELSSRMFGFLDRDQNKELDSLEQRSMRSFYYFGDKIPSEWDDNANERIEIYELLQHGSYRIAQTFDADSNDRISSLEMSRAMFNRADGNNDMKITSLEFYHWLIYR